MSRRAERIAALLEAPLEDLPFLHVAKDEAADALALLELSDALDRDAERLLELRRLYASLGEEGRC